MTFIFVFENIMWHFGFEVERQMKFVKHTHCINCVLRILQEVDANMKVSF